MTVLQVPSNIRAARLAAFGPPTVLEKQSLNCDDFSFEDDPSGCQDDVTRATTEATEKAQS